MYNRPTVAGQHEFESRKRGIDVAEIGNLGDPLELLRRHFFNGRKHRSHGVVDPDVNGAKLPFHALSCRFHLCRISNVHWKYERLTPGGFYFAPRSFQTVSATGDKTNPGAMLGKF